MSTKAKVDKNLYYKLKKQLNTPKDDKGVIDKYGIGQAMARMIRNSSDFESFLERTGRSVKSERKKATLTPQEQAHAAWFGFSILSIIAMLVVAGLILTWMFWK